MFRGVLSPVRYFELGLIEEDCETDTGIDMVHRIKAVTQDEYDASWVRLEQLLVQGSTDFSALMRLFRIDTLCEWYRYRYHDDSSSLSDPISFIKSSNWQPQITIVASSTLFFFYLEVFEGLTIA